jgi:hypothetical protein
VQKLIGLPAHPAVALAKARAHWPLGPYIRRIDLLRRQWMLACAGMTMEV